MEGLDILLLKAIFQSVQDERNSERIKNINIRLKQEHGLTFQEAFNKPDKMHDMLQKFEDDLKEIEDKILRNFLTMEKSTTTDTWIIVRDKHLAEMILKTYADVDKKAILDLTRDSAETIPKILRLCNLPNTSGYRKINQLIEEGFVIPTGLAESFEGKRAILYKSVIQKIQININKDIVITSISVPNEVLRSSQVTNMVLRINQDNVKSLAN
jgi:hypothetical protein